MPCSLIVSAGNFSFTKLLLMLYNLPSRLRCFSTSASSLLHTFCERFFQCCSMCVGAGRQHCLQSALQYCILLTYTFPHQRHPLLAAYSLLRVVVAHMMRNKQVHLLSTRFRTLVKHRHCTTTRFRPPLVHTFLQEPCTRANSPARYPLGYAASTLISVGGVPICCTPLYQSSERRPPVFYVGDICLTKGQNCNIC